MAVTHFFPHLWLASQSPRRQEILQMAGFSFEVHTQKVEEKYPLDINIEEVPMFLSQLKLKPFQTVENQWVLACDTLVFLDGEILGKPKTEAEAINMLIALSGKKHTVISGFSLLWNEHIWSFSEKTEVFFKVLPPEWIQNYVSVYQPLDKAGAYGIQEYIGMLGIERIQGDFYNVMGLPVARLAQEWTILLKHLS